MKKSREELKALMRQRIEDQFPKVNPNSDAELFTLLPDNQHEIKIILASLVAGETEDPWVRESAACYLIEYFADPFFIKKMLCEVVESFLAIRSPRIQSFLTEFLQGAPGLTPQPQTETDRVENLLRRIAQIAYCAEETIKKWAWGEGGKLTCSIGDKKLF